MRYVVSVADMKIADQSDDVVVTHALGSCLGLAIYDPGARLGGILHVMLPSAKINPERAKENPFVFVDTGTPLFFKEAYRRGARKERLIVKVAGGASLGDGPDHFAIGKRNFIMLRRLFWQNGIIIAGEDVGGKISRTMVLDIASGRTSLQAEGRRWEI